MLSRNKVDDLILLIQPDAGSIHPGFVAIHQRQRIPRILHKRVQHRVLKDDIRLKQKRILFAQPVFRQRQRIDVVRPVIDRVLHKGHRHGYIQRPDIILKLLSFIACHHDHASQISTLQLAQHPLDEGHAADLHHAFCIIPRQLLQPFSHPGGQYDCLHRSTLLLCDRQFTSAFLAG